MIKSDSGKQAMLALEDYLDALYDRAYEIVDAHWAVVREMERKSSGWENKSELQLRCNRKGNSIVLAWNRVRWYGSKQKGNRMRQLIHIAKPAGSYAYSLSKLLSFAKEWEQPLVRETEEKLAAIRQEASHVVKAVIALRHALNRAASVPMEESVEEENDASSNQP